MTEQTIRTEETEHTGDLERCAAAIRRFPGTPVVHSRCGAVGEYGTGRIVVETTLTRAELRARLNAGYDTEGFCIVLPDGAE
jgi:hypothetical protein